MGRRNQLNGISYTILNIEWNADDADNTDVRRFFNWVIACQNFRLSQSSISKMINLLYPRIITN
jgi:hypothetical protein